MISNITLIGAGNLATQLGLCLKEKKIKINQVYSKSLISAKTLSKKLNCVFIVSGKIFPRIFIGH